MPYLVFVQRSEPRVDFVGLAENARRWFAASIEVLAEQGFDPAGPPTEETRTRLAFEANGRVEFWLTARRTRVDDLAAAERAEVLGRAGGMASLAARCQTVWEVEPTPPDDEVLTLNFLALAASVALGPVMPPDGATLYGVRGARERAARLAQKA